MLNKDLLRHGLEFARAIDAHQYEITPVGIRFPRQRALVAGQFTTRINGADTQVDPNVVPVEALNYLLKAGLKNSGGLGNWYVFPFLNNVTPGSSLTAATINSVLDEWTVYDETARPAYTLPADPTDGVFTNAASPAVFTAGAVGGAGVDIWGMGILSTATKEDGTGKVFCASKFASARKLFQTDKLTGEYEVAATSA